MLELSRSLMRLALAALLLLPLLAAAQQYRWTDDKGRVQYTDTAPPASAKNVQRRAFGSAAAAPDAASALDQAVARSPVVLYTAPACDAPCRTSRGLLEQRGIPYTEFSAFDEASIAELKRATGDGKVPSLKVGETSQIGFSAAAWNAALDAAGYPARSAGTGPASRPEIKLYTNSGCAELCAEARAYLESRNVQFAEVAVEDTATVEELRKLTGQQNVPVLTIGNFVQRGFDAALYSRALDSAGYPGANQ